jgi:hypothetical protein
LNSTDLFFSFYVCHHNSFIDVGSLPLCSSHPIEINTFDVWDPRKIDKSPCLTRDLDVIETLFVLFRFAGLADVDA